MIERVYDALEGSWSGWFAVSCMGDMTNALPVSFAVSGTATSETDYTCARVIRDVIPAGMGVEILEVEAVVNGAYDPDETVIVTLQTGSGYTLASEDEATVILDEAPEITVEKIADTTEGGSAGTIRFTRSGPDRSGTDDQLHRQRDCRLRIRFTALCVTATFAANSSFAEWHQREQ